MALRIALRAFVTTDGAWTLGDLEAALLYADELAVAVILTGPVPCLTEPFGPGEECALTAEGAARPVALTDELQRAITAGAVRVRPNRRDIQHFSVEAMLRAVHARRASAAEEDANAAEEDGEMRYAPGLDSWNQERRDVGRAEPR